MLSTQPSRFEFLFQDPLYLGYKNYLYNFLVRKQVIRERLKKRRPGKILEIGCGVSSMTSGLTNVVRTDISWQALHFLGRRGGDFGVACSATEFPFVDGTFDGIVCSEVLEHIEDDGKALREMARVLRYGGRLFLTCPIHPEYFAFDDEFVGHYRRYEVSSLIRSLESNGFGDVETEPVLGSLEKKLMLMAVRIYSRLKKTPKKSTSPQTLYRLLAVLFFPVYVVINLLLAMIVHVQARLSSLERVATILIQCRKLS